MTIQIDNSDIAKIIQIEAKNKNMTIGEYIRSLVLKELELKKAQKEIESMQKEFQAYKNENITLEDASTLLKAL